MRSAKLITHFELKFSGSVSPNAIFLGDVDNDGENELIIGNSEGTLAIFKGSTSNEPWKVCYNLGHITTITLGDIFNIGRNAMVVINTEGWCSIYDMARPQGYERELDPNVDGYYIDLLESYTKAADANDLNSSNEDGDGSGSSSTDNAKSASKTNLEEAAELPQMEKSLSSDADNSDNRFDILADDDLSDLNPVLRQRLPANIKQALICDWNNDSKNELVVALTDRVARSFQFEPQELPRKQSEAACLAEQMAEIKLEEEHQSKPEVVKPVQSASEITSMQSNGDSTSTLNTNEAVPEEDIPDDDDIPAEYHGSLAALNKWEFGFQIGSVTRQTNSEGDNHLLVSQPGSGFLKIVACPEEDIGITYENLTSNFNHDHKESIVTSEIVGCLNEGQNAQAGISAPFAMATADGTLTIARNSTALWSVNMNHQLFGLHACDITGDGRDEIVVSSWDGNTFIATQDEKVTELLLDESIFAFTCGQFVVGGQLKPVLFFVTYSGKILAHYDFIIFKDEISKLALSQEELDLLRMHNIKIETEDDLIRLNHFLLNHFHA